MKNKFASERLREEIYGLKEFSYIGGTEPGLSLPLITKKDGELYVVFFVFTVTDEMPGAFVLCKNGADPVYLKYKEGLDKLGIREEDIDLIEIPFETDDVLIGISDDEYRDPDFSEELPGDMFKCFDEAYGDGKINEKAYNDYLDMLISQNPPELRKYIDFFRM